MKTNLKEKVNKYLKIAIIIRKRSQVFLTKVH